MCIICIVTSSKDREPFRSFVAIYEIAEGGSVEVVFGIVESRGMKSKRAHSGLVSACEDREGVSGKISMG